MKAQDESNHNRYLVKSSNCLHLGWCVTVWPCGIRDNFASLIIPRSETKLTMIVGLIQPCIVFSPFSATFCVCSSSQGVIKLISPTPMLWEKAYRRVQLPACLLLSLLPASLFHFYYDKNVIHLWSSVLYRQSWCSFIRIFLFHTHLFEHSSLRSIIQISLPSARLFEYPTQHSIIQTSLPPLNYSTHVSASLTRLFIHLWTTTTTT